MCVVHAWRVADTQLWLALTLTPALIGQAQVAGLEQDNLRLQGDQVGEAGGEGTQGS